MVFSKILAATARQKKLQEFTEQIKQRVPSKTAIINDGYNSDAETLTEDEKTNVQVPDSFPVMTHQTPVNALFMTVVSQFEGKAVSIKGNQLIFWARQVLEHAIDIAVSDNIREAKLKAPEIESSCDWIILEGLFDAFPKKPARYVPPLEGDLEITISGNIKTKVNFAYNKYNILYCNITDEKLIDFISKRLNLNPFSMPGLSYPDICSVISKIKQVYNYTDNRLAEYQLKILKQEDVGQMKKTYRFLAFFNAVLFGSEGSRNNLSFITGVMILELIKEGHLTYDKAFKSPRYKDIETGKAVNYAAYPMSSPYAGAQNFVGYLELMETTFREQRENIFESIIGMKLPRQFPQWSQIPIKEALLIKFWLQKTDFFKDQNIGETIAVARDIQRSIASLLEKYFPIFRVNVVDQNKLDEHLLSGIFPIIFTDLSVNNHPGLQLLEKRKQTEGSLDMVYLDDTENETLEGEFFNCITMFDKKTKQFYKYLDEATVEEGICTMDEYDACFERLHSDSTSLTLRDREILKGIKGTFFK